MSAPRLPARPRRLDPERLGDHVDRLFRAAWAMCGSPHDAEDLVQEAYARVLARPRWIRHDDDLGYLLRVLHNTYASRLRQAGRRPAEVPLDERLASVASRDHDGPEAGLEAHELFAAIAALPPWAREAIVIVDVAGLSYGEAAAVLDVKEATVATRLHRARRRVADALGSEDRPRTAAPL